MGSVNGPFFSLIGNRMDTIYADYSVSMSEFKKNPAQVL